ncbi:hypothetical protein Q9966_014178 [Columba livia]|nr:hypothetical protein Q9966_014178 [Columba livia]
MGVKGMTWRTTASRGQTGTEIMDIAGRSQYALEGPVFVCSGRNGPVSYGTVCGLNNDVDVTQKGKCDSEVVLIANRCAKLKTLDELKNKEE